MVFVQGGCVIEIIVNLDIESDETCGLVFVTGTNKLSIDKK